MNMRINQQSLDALISDAGKNKIVGAKQLKGNFGKALAIAVKAVPRQEPRQVSPGSKEVVVRLVKTENALPAVPRAAVQPTGNVKPPENVQPQSGTPDSLTTPEGGQETELNPNVRPDGKATGKVQGQSAREKSLTSGDIKPEQDANGDERSWWLELMSLLNFLAQLAEANGPEKEVPGTEDAELQVSIMEVSRMQIPEIQASEKQIPGIEVFGIQIPGIEVPEVQVSEKQVSGIQVPQIQVPATLIPEEQLSGVPAETDPATVPEIGQYLKLVGSQGLESIEVPGGFGSEVFPTVPNPVADQLKQAGEQVDPQLVTVLEDTNRAELQKLSARLKPLLDQLLQGKITISAAAEAILENPGLMEQIALQVKLLKLQQPNSGQLTEEAAIPLQQSNPAEEKGAARHLGRVLETGGFSTSKPAIPVELPGVKESSGNQGMIKDNGNLVNPSEKDPVVDNNKGNKETNDPEGKDKSGSGGRREYFVAGMKTETPFKAPDNLFKLNELEQQPWALQTGLKNDEQSSEALARTVRTQTVNTARELATHLIFKQIVNSSQLLVGRDHSEIRLQLRPEFLGKVSLEIAVEHGIVKAEIAAENQQVKQLIEANLGNLKQSLTNQGLKVDQLVVNLGQGQSQFGQAKGQGGQPGRSTRRSQDSEVVFEVGETAGEYGGHLAGENRVVDYKI